MSNIQKSFKNKAKRGLCMAVGGVLPDSFAGVKEARPTSLLTGAQSYSGTSSPMMPNQHQSLDFAGSGGTAQPVQPTVPQAPAQPAQPVQSTTAPSNPLYKPGSAEDPHATGVSLQPLQPMRNATSPLPDTRRPAPQVQPVELEHSNGLQGLRAGLRTNMADGGIVDDDPEMAARIAANQAKFNPPKKPGLMASLFGSKPAAPAPAPEKSAAPMAVVNTIRNRQAQIEAAANMQRGGVVKDGAPAHQLADDVPVNLTRSEAVLPPKTVQALGGPEAVEELIERTNGKPPVRGIRAGGKYAGGFVPTDDLTYDRVQGSAPVRPMPTQQNTNSAIHPTEVSVPVPLRRQPMVAQPEPERVTQPQWGRDVANALGAGIDFIEHGPANIDNKPRGLSSHLASEGYGGVALKPAVIGDRGRGVQVGHNSPPVAATKSAPTIVGDAPLSGERLSADDATARDVYGQVVGGQAPRGLRAGDTYRYGPSAVVDSNENMANGAKIPYGSGTGIASMRQKDGSFRNVLLGQQNGPKWEDGPEYKEALKRNAADKQLLADMQRDRILRTAAMPGATDGDRLAYAGQLKEDEIGAEKARGLASAQAQMLAHQLDLAKFQHDLQKTQNLQGNADREYEATRDTAMDKALSTSAQEYGEDQAPMVAAQLAQYRDLNFKRDGQDPRAYTAEAIRNYKLDRALNETGQRLMVPDKEWDGATKSEWEYNGSNSNGLGDAFSTIGGKHRFFNKATKQRLDLADIMRLPPDMQATFLSGRVLDSQGKRVNLLHLIK